MRSNGQASRLEIRGQPRVGPRLGDIERQYWKQREEPLDEYLGLSCASAGPDPVNAVKQFGGRDRRDHDVFVAVSGGEGGQRQAPVFHVDEDAGINQGCHRAGGTRGRLARRTWPVTAVRYPSGTGRRASNQRARSASEQADPPTGAMRAIGRP